MTPAGSTVRLRRRNGLTQAELARRAGTSQPVVSAYEHGRRDPTFGTLRRLVEAGGERLRHRRRAAARPAARGDVDEHARRLLDVLSLADAIPARPRADGAARAPPRLVVTELTLARADRRARRVRWRAIPHAFGGALALAYYAEPRATIDIDLNVFVPAERFAEVAAPLVELGVAADDPEVADAGAPRRSGSRDSGTRRRSTCSSPTTRSTTPRRARRRTVPFADSHDPDPRRRAPRRVQGGVRPPQGLGRHRRHVAAERPIDVAEVLRWVGRIAGDEDPRYERIAAVLTRR